jgi:F0F1-type ATP synthase alpha subunit
MPRTINKTSWGFNDYLKASGEVGYAERVVSSIVEIAGLPGVKLGEMVMLETGQLAQVMALNPKRVEVLVLSGVAVRTGTRATRMGRKR